MFVPLITSTQPPEGWDGSDGDDPLPLPDGPEDGPEPSDGPEDGPEDSDPLDGPEDGSDEDGPEDGTDGPEDGTEADPEDAEALDALADDVDSLDSDESLESLEDGEAQSLLSSSRSTIKPTPIVSVARTSVPAPKDLARLFQTVISCSSPSLGLIAVLRLFSSVLSRYWTLILPLPNFLNTVS